uniref:single-stranded DNA-binding protein n=1 Tax=Aeromonas sp. Ne-1 TaxID=1675689 RepID=UPI001563F429
MFIGGGLMYQSCVFVGRTTKNAKIFITESGTAVCNFNIAINRKNSSQADFIPCV